MSLVFGLFLAIQASLLSHIVCDPMREKLVVYYCTIQVLVGVLLSMPALSKMI